MPQPLLPPLRPSVPGTPRTANTAPATPAAPEVSSLPQIPQQPLNQTGQPIPQVPMHLSALSAYPAGSATPESLIATSRAAEHWHRSWIDRQRAEAGPAIDVARGQAPVAPPLLAMQHSFARMRAIILPKKTGKLNNSMGFGFWITIVIMICLIGGLGAYIVYTYLPGTPLQTQTSASTNGLGPTLVIVPARTPTSTTGQNQGNRPDTNTTTAGQTLYVHGDHFGVNDPITFFLNTTQLPVSVRSSGNGSFNASIPISATTLAGAYELQAQDNHTGKHAFLDIQVLSATNRNTTNAVIITSLQGQPLTGLTFKATVDTNNSPVQHIVLKNQSAAAILWTINTVTANGVSWLLVNDNTSGGTLNRDGTANIGISVLTTGLQNGTYTGQVIFTINGRGQAFLPVTLTIGD
jgi:hypothetical protein